MKAVRLAIPMLAAWTLVVLWLSLAGVASAAGEPTTVCPAGPPDCRYATIQAAIEAAPPGSVIRIASGVYRDLHDRPRYGTPGDEAVTQVVYITKPLTLQGGYQAPAFREPPDPIINPTVLNAGSDGRGVYILGATGPITVIIDGLQVTGGVAAHGEQLSGNQDYGGGLYVVSATLTLQNSRIVSNTAGTGGAGIYLYQSTATLQNNEIERNQVTGMAALNCCSGGGINSSQSNLTLLGNRIAANSAELTGGVDHSGGALLMANNLISANVGTEAAGGVRVIAAPATIRSNQFVGNQGALGALWLWFNSGNDEIAYNVFTGNGGGGVTLGPGVPAQQQGSTHMVGNRFVGNTGTELSIQEQRSVRAINNVFLGDPAAGQRAVVIDGSEVDMLHTTVAGPAGGSGIGVDIGSGSPQFGGPALVTLTNSIFAGQGIGIRLRAAAIVTVTGVLWDGNGVNVDNSGAYAEAGAVAGAAQFAGDGYHLQPGSAAIDAGQDTGVQEDIDRFPRPYAEPDLGADEYWPPAALKWLYIPEIARNWQP